MRRIPTILASFMFILTAATPVLADNRPCEGDNACQGRQKKGCAEATAPCEDNDNVQIIICPQPGSCEFKGEPS